MARGRTTQSRRDGANQVVIHGLGSHDDAGHTLGNLLGLLPLAHVAELVDVHPALVEPRDPDQVCAEGLGYVFDLLRGLFRGAEVDLLRCHATIKGELVAEALTAILVFLEFGKEIADMPRGVPERVVLLSEAVRFPEGLQGFPIGGVEESGFLAPNALVPPRAAKNITLLVEALEVVPNVEACGLVVLT